MTAELLFRQLDLILEDYYRFRFDKLKQYSPKIKILAFNKNMPAFSNRWSVQFSFSSTSEPSSRHHISLVSIETIKPARPRHKETFEPISLLCLQPLLITNSARVWWVSQQERNSSTRRLNNRRTSKSASPSSFYSDGDRTAPQTPSAEESGYSFLSFLHQICD